MELSFPTERDRITIAILAMGGQGGGVLADWIIELANRNGYIAQGTSVPGVAQRTGTTVYYVEMVRKHAAGANRPAPVLAMMPVPGDVDIVIASELMEAGRAILRGFVTEDRTILIGSTHRIYAISEKSALGDGIAASERILDAASRRSRRFIGFDMDEAATASGSVISSVMLGALAGSEALPFTREMFEEEIRRGGKAVEANLKGFGLGVMRAHTAASQAIDQQVPPAPTTEAGRALLKQLLASLPDVAHPIATAGVAKLMDYQDANYAGLYLDRLTRIRAADGGADDWRITRETARYLALWMAYEDTIRVADLKVRASRTRRVESEVRLGSGQIMTLTEYMHPRLREVCETLPAWLGRYILQSPVLSRRIAPLFERGRHVRTTSLGWFLALHTVAGMRRFRRSTLRYVEEQKRIEDWLDAVLNAAGDDPRLAAELAGLPRLIKGYGETFERGISRFQKILASVPTIRRTSDAGDRVASLQAAALADEQGTAFSVAIAEMEAAA